MALGVNVKKRRMELGLTQSELANLVSVSQVAIANLERRDSRSSRNLIALADALQCSVRELESGTAVNESPTEYRIKSSFVPILNMNEIKDWRQIINAISNKSQISAPKIGGGKNTFCFQVEGSSMTAPIGSKPSFPEGYIVHVDPDVAAENNDFVVAKTAKEQIVFKQLKFEDGRNYLKSINPEFSIDFADFKIIAVVIGASLNL